MADIAFLEAIQTNEIVHSASFLAIMPNGSRNVQVQQISTNGIGSPKIQALNFLLKKDAHVSVRESRSRRDAQSKVHN